MTNTTNYSNKNAAAVLAQVQAHIAELEEANKKSFPELAPRRFVRQGWGENRRTLFDIGEVCDELSIFDWWNDNLSKGQLKQMETFLKQAIKLGFTGYVCFKVGATGCAHGMWAHKKETTTGYSPDGDVLFHSFRSGDNYFDMELGGKWMRDILPGRDENEYEFTMAEVKQALDMVAKQEEKRTKLGDVLCVMSEDEQISIQIPAEENTTGILFNGTCRDFIATKPEAVAKYINCNVDRVRAYNDVVIIALA